MKAKQVVILTPNVGSAKKVKKDDDQGNDEDNHNDEENLLDA